MDFSTGMEIWYCSTKAGGIQKIHTTSYAQEITTVRIRSITALPAPVAGLLVQMAVMLECNLSLRKPKNLSYLFICSVRADVPNQGPKLLWKSYCSQPLVKPSASHFMVAKIPGVVSVQHNLCE